MCAAASSLERLWLELGASDSVEQVCAILDQLDGMPRDATAPSLGDALARSFRRLQDLTIGDPAIGERLIRERLLPFCQMHFPETESYLTIGQHRARECLRDWVNQYPDEARFPLRDRVLDILRDGLPTAPSEAGDTVAVIGYRRNDLLRELGKLCERDDEQGDGALGNLAMLGVPTSDRHGVLGQLHRRLAKRCNSSLIFALTRLADPDSIEPVARRLRHLDNSELARARSGSLLLRVLVAIAERQDADGALQDRIWQVLSDTIAANEPAFAWDLYLGSDVLPRCDSTEAIPSLLARLVRPSGDDKRSVHDRWLIYLRLADCIRPRQLSAWAESVVRVPAAVELVRRDATQDSMMTGLEQTFEFAVKRAAWDTALCLGTDRVFDWYATAVGSERERSPFARRDVTDRLACFRLDSLPALALHWIIDEFDSVRDAQVGDAELVARLSAVRLAHSAATVEAFDALLNFGLTMDGKVPLETAEALGDVAIALARDGYESPIQRLVSAAASRQPSRQRTAATAALERVAQRGVLPANAGEVLFAMATDAEREPFERGAIVAALGFLPREKASTIWHATLRELARRDDWLGARSLEALARFGWLDREDELLQARLGLERRGDQWEWARDTSRAQWAAFSLGLLYVDYPDRFHRAVATALMHADWRSATQLTEVLQQRHAQVSAGKAPESVIKALLSRAHNRQRASSAELDLFSVLATLAPDTLALERWDRSWDDWPPDSRAALADALARAAFDHSDAMERATNLLLLLVQDGSLGVRRAAYRALGRRFPNALRELCIAWMDSKVLHLRVRAAEAAGWLPQDSDGSSGFDRIASSLSVDDELAVRERIDRSRQERRDRAWADDYMRRLRQVQPDSIAAQLGAWAYGRALTRVGDDATVAELQRLAEEDASPHRRFWFAALAKDADQRWRDTMRNRSEPRLTRAGVIERYEALAVLPDGRELPMRVALWARPAGEPTPLQTWGGTGSVGTIDGFAAFSDPAGQEFTLRLEDDREGQAGIDSVSFGGTITFRGLGKYPEKGRDT